MMRKSFAALVLVLTVAAPLRADLKYTTHTELKPATAAEAEAPNPMLGMLGGQMAQQLLPNGPADTVYIINEKGVRTEYVKGGMSMNPEGSISLTMTNGDLIQLNPKDKTYWKSTAQQLNAMMQATGMQPEVTVKPTEETATIAGVRTKRSTFAINIPLPIPEQMRSQLPAGFPTALTMSGEAWLATAPFEKYVAVSSKMAQFASGMGLNKLMENGIVMRQVLRSQVFGGQQLEVVVTKIGEETSPAGLFEIPADYKEVPSPIK